MFSYTVVGGRFDDQGGKPSGYIKKLFDALQTINPFGSLTNGGSFTDLEAMIKLFPGFFGDVIFWMPDVPNDKEKIVRLIKANFPQKFLITSKNNLDQRYQTIDLVGRALQTKSNLFIEFVKLNQESQIVYASVLDPLGNCYIDHSSNITHVAIALMVRIFQITKFTRVKSVSSKKDYSIPKIPEKFLEQTKKYAEVFHDFIHADTSRFLGNVSFRCEKGFPSFKIGKQIYVSKRNIDKREINEKGFVPVELIIENENNNIYVEHNIFVHYDGLDKPSVDTPIQLLLYRYYRNINFMIHSHTYILLAPFTKEIIPCGAIEEFDEIIQQFPNRDSEKIFINLKGHGSIAMFSTLDDFDKIKYEPRPMPEIQWMKHDYP